MGFMDSRNMFDHCNCFVGDIEDGKRYPFNVFNKEESDERYAKKSTEADLSTLAAEVATKADESETEAIRARLDALEYIPIKINSFTASPSLCEMGSENTIELTWSLNKSPTSQNINGTPVTDNTKQYAGVSYEQTYTLNVTDGQTNVSKSVNISFANQIYYGVAADLTTITELSKVLSNNKSRTITVDAGAGEYIIYAIPSRLGDVAFYVSGFEGGFEAPVYQLITNESGYQEMYKIYRSTNANLGETTVEVKGG
jgi:hypothetical protein